MDSDAQDDTNIDKCESIDLPDDPREKVDFGTFAISLGHSAYISMGKAALPDGSIEPVDLEGARQMIDVLEMLRKKTQGNLDANEENMLCGLLCELRLAYVELID